jgi:hypothetical protein
MTNRATDTLRAELRSRFGDAVVDAHTRSIRHRHEVEGSSTCGCFYCRRIFSPKEIREWIRNEDTALCPHCGIDSVLGSASGYEISVTFLTRMHAAWFGSARAWSELQDNVGP